MLHALNSLRNRLVPCLNCARPLPLPEVIDLLNKSKFTRLHLDVSEGDPSLLPFSIAEANAILDIVPTSAHVHVWPSVRRYALRHLRSRDHDIVSVHLSRIRNAGEWGEWRAAIRLGDFGCVLDRGSPARCDLISRFRQCTVLAGALGTRGASMTDECIGTIQQLSTLYKGLHIRLCLDGGVSTASLLTVETLPVHDIVAGSLLFGNPPSFAILDAALSRL